jgi:hypothetical protein
MSRFWCLKPLSRQPEPRRKTKLGTARRAKTRSLAVALEQRQRGTLFGIMDGCEIKIPEYKTIKFIFHGVFSRASVASRLEMNCPSWVAFSGLFQIGLPRDVAVGEDENAWREDCVQ